MDFNILKQNLQQPFLQSNWKDWLLELIGSQYREESKAENIVVQKGNAKSIERFASIALSDDKNIAVLDIVTHAEVQIARNRVALRDIAFKLIDQDKYHGLLVFYHSENPNQQDYRMSFISSVTTIDEKGNFNTHSTQAKRYSFLLGANESCTTAALRLLELHNKLKPFKAFESNKKIALKDIKDAFSVEKLNNEFFKKYKDIHYKNFCDYILQKEEYAHVLMNNEEEQIDKKTKPIRDFVKKMLGRIVFLHFLQKKGWLGCFADSEGWNNGDKNYMQNLFTNFPKQTQFYSQCLTILFFQTLNTDRRNQNSIAPLALSLDKNATVKIPFLNGGLFDDDQPETNSFNFPVAYFNDLFEFFSQYNFTIDENSPEEQEVGIDPEMLGHIFENLLEENKDKGAFYTPKEIVHYMCQESLIQYLRTHLPECADNESEATKAIELFIRKDEVGNRTDKKNFVVSNAKRIEAILDKVKICDPAIGSGAFPMGMLQEIFKAKMTLDLTLDKSKVKKEIIQNSIYGVDIERGAVDIARLRFWLSLVVDEEVPQPLPNLDYKIMQGNSLLESFEGIDLSNLLNDKDDAPIIYAQNEQVQLFAPEKQNIMVFEAADQQQLQELINLYFDFEEQQQTEYASKQAVKQAINIIVEGKLKAHFYIEQQKQGGRLKDEQKKLLANTIHGTAPKGIVDKKTKANEKIQKGIDAITTRLSELEGILSKLSLWEQCDKERPYFLWHTYFKAVFDQGGFDIVIGNPPYIQLQKLGDDLIRLGKANFQTFSRTSDIYCLFYEQGFNLLKQDGVLTYITSNTWMRTKFGELLRNYFSKHTQTIALINFEDTKIFRTATVETNIIINKKTKTAKPFKAVAVMANYRLGTNIYDYFQNNAIEIKDPSDDGWVILEKDDFVIKNKIEENGVPLKYWDVEFYRGMLTGFNDAFYINEGKRKELIDEDPNSEIIIKRLLRGREIYRWGYKFNDNYAIYPHNGLKENVKKGTKALPRIDVTKDFPAIYKHLLQYRDKNSPLAKKNEDGTYQTLIDRTDQGTHWTNIRDCAYLLSLEEEKLVWLAITDKPAFAYDNKQTYISNPSYFMSGHNLKYLLVFLNSKVIEWYLDKISSSTGQGTNQWNKMYIELLPVPKTNNKGLIAAYEKLADYLIFLNNPTQPAVNKYADNVSIAPIFEDVANMMVYELYFTEHLKELELDVLQFIDTEQYFKPIDTTENADAEANAKIIGECYNWLQKQDNPIRNRILLSNIKSPDIIKRINASTH
ncbi:Eco57I restriction-modification methylase domain-containing protein [Sphingobacterium sp.]|uniref:Eco57I restriction-modification methylase domain-containing protein n=1 Tax=Sphingobacterium sp. TaxID=341027 RepID=UPI0028994204|nr:TaqI-like C-terminal specificity domain-containing protein [Sphingobacterium sp.]